jgi:hypothetical protein
MPLRAAGRVFLGMRWAMGAPNCANVRRRDNAHVRRARIMAERHEIVGAEVPTRRRQWV